MIIGNSDAIILRVGHFVTSKPFHNTSLPCPLRRCPRTEALVMVVLYIWRVKRIVGQRQWEDNRNTTELKLVVLWCFSVVMIAQFCCTLRFSSSCMFTCLCKAQSFKRVSSSEVLLTSSRETWRKKNTCKCIHMCKYIYVYMYVCKQTTKTHAVYAYT